MTVHLAPPDWLMALRINIVLKSSMARRERKFLFRIFTGGGNPSVGSFVHRYKVIRVTPPNSLATTGSGTSWSGDRSSTARWCGVVFSIAWAPVANGANYARLLCTKTTAPLLPFDA